MSTLQRALRALPMTFAIYAVEAACALFATLPFGLALENEGISLRDPVSRAALLDAAPRLLFGLSVAGHAVWLSALLLVLLTPCLSMAWLAALTEPRSLREALAEGARHYLRACLISLGCLLLLGALLAPWALGLYLCERLLGAGRYARVHDVALFGLAMLSLFSAVIAHVIHDLARVRGLAQGPLHALRGALRDAARVRPWSVFTAVAGLGLALRAGHLWVFANSTALGTSGGTLVLQLTCLGALFVRSLWLGWACQARASTSPPFA